MRGIKIASYNGSRDGFDVGEYFPKITNPEFHDFTKKIPLTEVNVLPNYSDKAILNTSESRGGLVNLVA